ncbi:MAG: methyltransferase domain-containing protein [Bryobacteraceae bacterium]|nr:methyltransferase domain-containing protein [Bryobacteraceae bacterium]
MSLVDEYERQFQWRDWKTVLDSLPSLHGQIVFDLGCGIGDLAAELAVRGAEVIAADMNEALLQSARVRAKARPLERVEFRAVDLRTDVDWGIRADGVWCSFLAAYFVDLPPALTSWTKNLKPGGWIALTEVDDMFGHQPLSPRTTARLTAYYDDSLAAGRYDFRAGRKLKQHLGNAGFCVTHSLTLEDRELSFNGPADPGVVEAWRSRFERMHLLRQFLEDDFDQVRSEFLDCLTREDHRSTAKVYTAIGNRNP